MSDSEMLIQFDDKEAPNRPKRSVMFEDDGQVAWAYLLIEGKITSGVWLYNHGIGPASFEARDGAPLNVRGDYRTDIQFPAVSQENLSVRWDGSGADLRVNGEWVASLRLGENPGCSLLSTRSNGAARPLRLAKEIPVYRQVASD